MENEKEKYHDKLQRLMDEYVDFVYIVTKKFPKEELFGVTSQLRRAALSLVLNYIEGYARRRKAVLKNFLEISCGSVKECKYLVYFSYKQTYISQKDYLRLDKMVDDIAKMLWGIISKL